LPLREGWRLRDSHTLRWRHVAAAAELAAAPLDYAAVSYRRAIDMPPMLTLFTLIICRYVMSPRYAPLTYAMLTLIHTLRHTPGATAFLHLVRLLPAAGRHIIVYAATHSAAADTAAAAAALFADTFATAIRYAAGFTTLRRCRRCCYCRHARIDYYAIRAFVTLPMRCYAATPAAADWW